MGGGVRLLSLRFAPHPLRSCLAAGEYSGGVPLFWQHLQRALSPRASARRTLELTALSSTFLPMFGIGIVWPHSGGSGTAELGGAGDVTKWPAWKGHGPEALWVELCAPASLRRQQYDRGSDDDDSLHRAPVNDARSSTGRLAAEFAPLIRHPVCARASSSDLIQFVGATKRRPNQGSLEYAMARWYNGSSAPNPQG